MVLPESDLSIPEVPKEAEKGKAFSDKEWRKKKRQRKLADKSRKRNRR
jgi:hypothetical protein